MTRRRPLAIATALVIVIALAASVAVWWRQNGEPTAIRQDRQGPVLLVPGRAADTDALVALQRRLLLAGRRAIIISTGISDTGDLRLQADEVEAMAQRMVREGATSVDVVGFSAGGLVARIWLADGGSAITRRVVTIATPNRGVAPPLSKGLVTERFCATTCAQLTPGSALLKSLPPVEGQMPWMNLWTERDRIVAPGAASLPGATDLSLQSVCSGSQSGHSQIAQDPLTIGIVLRALDPASLTAPTAADCSALRADGAPIVVAGPQPTEEEG